MRDDDVFNINRAIRCLRRMGENAYNGVANSCQQSSGEAGVATIVEGWRGGGPVEEEVHFQPPVEEGGVDDVAVGDLGAGGDSGLDVLAHGDFVAEDWEGSNMGIGDIGAEF